MQTSQTNEQALESAIEKALTGTCLEDIKANGTSIETANIQERQALYETGNGFYIGNAQDFNAKYAIDETHFWQFLENTQAQELEKIKRYPDWQLRILERYHRMVKKYGILRLLRKGLEIEDAHFTLLYQAPMASSSQAVKQNFELNQFSVTRQVRYNLDNLREEIDMVIFVNGIALITVELKNQWTGQNAKTHGIHQYKTQRDTKQPLLNFGRCIVHFTVDTDEAYMCTKLAGKNSFFLPFNKGKGTKDGKDVGKGNPINPNGHKTAYLWQEVFTRHSLANIIQHFVRFNGKVNTPLKDRTLFFPRYHQMDVVRKLLQHATQNGVNQTYLIQHSAGSGKSNSITWLAYQLIEVYPANANVKGTKNITSPLFDSVIVVTDRRLLDKQIRENIKEFSQVNIIAPAHSSAELRESLEQGKKIIITTVHKFSHILTGISDLSHKRFAVIIDEAHSSQGGTLGDNMNRAMGTVNAKTKATDEDTNDAQTKILQAMKSRKMKGNASYFAFTATPKEATLERFGTKQTDGKYKPFHLYSMKQAIEEGFILDVLANYTTYKSYYEIEKSIHDNPLFDTKKAQKKLKAFVEKDKRTVATKAEIMMEHFFTNVFQPKKLKNKAKGMVITQDIKSAVRYYFALNKILEEKGNPFKIAIAFSGKKTVDGVKYTETDLNGFADKDTKDKFDTDEYRLLVVANKYLTGFDQPKLCTMYVDKKLQGVLAVQALSRLNRSADKLGKCTESLFILDFYNDVNDIKNSFDNFYTSTTLSEATDVNVLHELKGSLEDVGVFEQSEIDDFNIKYFNGEDAQELSPIIDVSAQRFNHDLELEDEAKADFKIKAKQFVKIYGQMAALLPYEKIEWEKLFWFLKFLIPKLIVKTKEDEIIDELLESVDLSTYGLERTKLGYSIALDETETELDPQNPNPRGVHGDTEKDDLDEIIKTFNERWFHGWEATPEDQRVKFMQVSEKLMQHPDIQEKYFNNPDVHTRDLALNSMLKEVLNQQRRQELELYKLTAKDEAFYQAFFDTMKRMIDSPRMR